jgi:hypothetical protein
MNMHVGTSPSSQPYIQKIGLLAYRINTSQILPVSQKKAFSFFKDLRNLSDITPAWIDSRTLNKENER